MEHTLFSGQHHYCLADVTPLLDHARACKRLTPDSAYYQLVPVHRMILGVHFSLLLSTIVWGIESCMSLGLCVLNTLLICIAYFCDCYAWKWTMSYMYILYHLPLHKSVYYHIVCITPSTVTRQSFAPDESDVYHWAPNEQIRSHELLMIDIASYKQNTHIAFYFERWIPSSIISSLVMYSYMEMLSNNTIICVIVYDRFLHSILQ